MGVLWCGQFPLHLPAEAGAEERPGPRQVHAAQQAQHLPAKDKFGNTTRAFSHGCIRLSRPDELAYTLLGEEVGMSPQDIDAIWATNKTTRVDLPVRIPVHVVYATAFATDNGIEFRSDVYGRDKKLYAALFGRSAS